MRSALRTFTSALGVCAACYLLSTASWHQVLLLFMVASFGWCWFAFSSGLDEERAAKAKRLPLLVERLALQRASAAVPETMVPTAVQRQERQERQEQASRLQPQPRVQKVYRFPIHELTRGSLTPIADFD